MKKAANQREKILDCAVELAETSGWEAVRLHQVAASLDIGLADIQQHFTEKDQLIDAWFDRADQAALVASQAETIAALPPREKLAAVIMAWLDHLAPHRRVVREMIGAKAEIGHIHIQIPAVMRISRTVQWFREAAGCSDSLPLRAVVEAIHTGIYLVAFTFWMRDDSPDSERTRQLLHRMLDTTGHVLPSDPPLTTD